MSMRSTRFISSLLGDTMDLKIQDVDKEIRDAFLVSTGLLSASEAAYIRSVVRDYDFIHEMRDVNSRSIERLPSYVQEKIIEWDNTISLMRDRLESIARRDGPS